MSPSDPLIVAIDGPSASGKSTVSRAVAERLELLYVDSGSLYRGVTWKALREGVDPGDPSAVAGLLARMDCSVGFEGRTVRFLIGGVDPGPELRAEPVAGAVSDFAALPAVRGYVVERLRDLVRHGSLVMEGRDIGSVVFPDTPHKFYLEADPEERARRRFNDQAGREGGDDLAAVLGALNRRDRKDTTRTTDPLQVAEGAHRVNTNKMTAPDVAAYIVDQVKRTS